MTKLGVMTDSHRNLTMIRLALKEMSGCDYIVHCGDHDSDVKEEDVKPARLMNVPGNCDPGSFNAPERIVTLDGIKILITHGDAYGVKFSLTRLYLRALEAEAKLVLYGHSHCQKIDERDGITFLNAGALKNGACALVTLDDGMVSCRLMQL